MITYNECLKKLVDLGKDTGYITFKQINDILPNSAYFLDKVEDIIFDLVKIFKRSIIVIRDYSIKNCLFNCFLQHSHLA